MASYIQKLINLSAWMMNPTSPTILQANTIPSQHFKNKKSMRILNSMMTERERPATPETGTQVYGTMPTPTSTPTPKHATIETQTIETQTIQNLELLPYTDEEMVGHYTQELFQCEPATSASTSVPAPSSEDQTFTCSVCLETLNCGDKNTTLTPCGHAYHLSCLLSSLRTKNLCPMCRGSLEDPRPKQSTTNVLRPTNAEQIIRDELYWFPKSAHILNIRGSNHPRRAFKDSMRTFAYAVLQTTAEFVHADNVPEEWYSDDEDTDNESDDSNSENDDNSENAENASNDSENDDNTENDHDDNEDENDERELNNVRQVIRGDLRNYINV